MPIVRVARTSRYTGRAMRHSLLSVLLCAVGCTGDDDKAGGSIPVDTSQPDSGDTGSVKPPEIVLGDPYVVMVAATTPGSLLSTCELDLEVANKSDGGVAATLSLSAAGRDWSGAGLTGGTQYQATFTATGCTNAGDKDPYVTGTFSGQEGILFVLWYTGVNSGYDALEQGTEGADFTGGEATVTVALTTDDATVQAEATSVGVTATLTGADDTGNIYFLTWENELNVGAVLSAFTADLGDAYVSGTPTWISEPDWW
jgi:hypothetical protein